MPTKTKTKTKTPISATKKIKIKILKKSPKNTTKRKNIHTSRDKRSPSRTPISVNKMEWVLITKSNKDEFVISPEKIDDLGIFIYFFKRFIMQPNIRKYFVHKYRPEIPYYLVKIDSQDEYYEEKVRFIENKIKDKSNVDFIIDIAEQLSPSGGHWTSLKRENGILEYMDSDPFYYGNVNTSSDINKSFHQLVKNISNPIHIYGNRNIMNKGLRAEKSIQNLHKNDNFCQSWSLFFLTTSHLYPTISEKIRFQKGEVVLYEDKAKQFANFPAFLQNYIFLLDVWIHMFSDAKKEFIEIITFSQWKKWKPTKIIDKLKHIQRYLMKNQDNILSNMQTQEDMFCLYEGFTRDYMVKK